MKKYIIAFVVIMSSISLYAIKPLNTTAENKEKIIKIAYEVANRLAPDYDLDGLHPMTFIVDGFPKQYYERHNGGNLIGVYFMPDTTSTGFMSLGYYDPKQKKKIYKGKRPISPLVVHIWDNTFEPDGIMGNNGSGIFFTPSYEEFLKNNPDFKVKKENTDATRSIF